MSLQVQTRQESGVAVVAPRGKLTMEHGALLHEEVQKLVNGGARRLLVDLTGVDYIDSHGLGQMVACQSTVRSHGGRLCFTGLSDKLRRLLQMTTIPRILEFDPDLANAVKNLADA
ncbi:MAG: STAS domain-containing protein [Terriglobia bacterium]